MPFAVLSLIVLLSVIFFFFCITTQMFGISFKCDDEIDLIINDPILKQKLIITSPLIFSYFIDTQQQQHNIDIILNFIG